MALAERLKALFSNEGAVTRPQVEAFLKTEEGETLLVELIQAEMPDFFKEASKEGTKEEPTKEPEKEETEAEVFEKKEEGE